MVSGDQYIHSIEPVLPLFLRELPPFLPNLGGHTRAIGFGGGGEDDGAQKQEANEGREEVSDHLKDERVRDESFTVDPRRFISLLIFRRSTGTSANAQTPRIGAKILPFISWTPGPRFLFSVSALSLFMDPRSKSNRRDSDRSPPTEYGLARNQE